MQEPNGDTQKGWNVATLSKALLAATDGQILPTTDGKRWGFKFYRENRDRNVVPIRWFCGKKMSEKTLNEWIEAGVAFHQERKGDR